MDYNQTLNLPVTEFPMRAGLPKREPVTLEKWKEMGLYEKLMEKNESLPLYVLHDGPPYANGDIHMGHALNKIIKDFIVRSKNVTGFKAPYVPGWDTHGLPIESQVIKKNKVDRKKMSVAEFRDTCRDFAVKYMDNQNEQFQRLGVIGDWARPYVTLDPRYEAEQIRIFGAMFKKGYIYKGLKPVYWCYGDETALAEAEIEYADVPCVSIYVKFPVRDDHGKLSKYGDLSKMYFVIWTTTIWTLPGNLGISLSPELNYVLLKAENGEIYIVCDDLKESVAKAAGLENWEVLAKLPGSEFDRMLAGHPFYDRDSLIMLGDHVTAEAGTGCVHTAPGHGVDDYNIGRRYGLEVLVPVNDRGVMTEQAGKFEGLFYQKANDAIMQELKDTGMLLATEAMTHQYPHCWRCKNPVIYRATEQWFASVDAIKDTAVDACESIGWKPDWGKERMISMIRERSDWCISRQRNWGVPIPIVYCESCGVHIINDDTIESIANIFAAEGSNAWHIRAAMELLPSGYACPECGHKAFKKETDIMDVWFDSGSSHAAVLDQREDLTFPADLYFEGADQFRGWFQSSLLTSIAAKGVAPYTNVLTHGWTVDGEGKKMSKSLGNGMEPLELIRDYGADILRLWAASVDYTVDMRISKEIFKQLSGDYLKIRNTARFILGNLEDFDPNRDQVPYGELIVLDKWALMRLNKLIAKVRQAYDAFAFHVVYHAIHQFCVVDMSNYYLDIIKDRLYCDGPDSYPRRCAQTAMYRILDAMVRMLSPILAFTAEEIWQYMPHDSSADPESVMFNQIPQYDTKYAFTEAQEAEWENLRALRNDVNKALEQARIEKRIGKSLDAEVTLYVLPEGAERFETIRGQHFTADFIVSGVKIVDGDGDGASGEYFPGVKVAVSPARAEKCGRCWIHEEGVGKNDAHPGLCPRCAGVVDAQKS